MKKKHKRKKDAKNKKISDLLCQNSALKMKNRILEEIFRRQRYEAERWSGQQALYSVPDTDVGDKWNKYPEEKPKEKKCYQVYLYGEVNAMWWRGKVFDFRDDKITHWRELSEPPKEE